jgi:hypothetical protein
MHVTTEYSGCEVHMEIGTRIHLLWSGVLRARHFASARRRIVRRGRSPIEDASP